jgi:uncharacterized PurR-regulated membrane protein YhhQ (DUF165 family)
VSYGLLDIVNDWKGRQVARMTVESALIARVVFFVVVVPVLLLLPSAKPAPGFDALMGQSVRLFAAGWVSLFAGGWLVNTPFFSWLRERYKGRWFVLRYLTTSLPTIVVGSIVYGVLGFWGTGVDVFALIWGTAVARVAIAAVIVPAVWVVRVWVRRSVEQREVADAYAA